MKHSTFLATTTAAAFFATGAMAVPVDIEVIESVFQGAVGGTNIAYDPDGVLTDGTANVSWGVASTNTNPDGSLKNPDGLQSGYSFTPVATPFEENPDSPFALGTFTHNNWAINIGGGISSVDLRFLFGGSPVQTPAELRPAAEFEAIFRFTHTETPNVEGTCPEGSTTICDDLVMLTAIDGDTEVVRVGKVQYTFTLLGFGDTAEDAVGPGGRVFQTAEAGSSSTQLWATYSVSIIPLPAAGWLLLGGLGALGAVARRRRKAA